MNSKKKVYIGMSGGVDSSVSALLLKQAGYDVTGVFIKVWQPDFIECTWKEDRLDAMRVAAQLSIPFVTLDLEKEYKEGVIDYMIEEYKSGRTPNPDVMCNREVKFGAFWDWAKSHGADYIATGHYATTDGNQLHVSKDVNKDQTYFLWTLTQDDLVHVLLPSGHMKKDDVRTMATEASLYTSTKKDSQGLCFVGTIDVKTLLKEYIAEEKGDVKNEKGITIGTHTGVMFYTIGERHGFTITEKGIDDAPYFIIAKDFENNRLTVSHTPPKEKEGKIITLEKINWTEELATGNIYEARARYRAPLAKVKIIDSTHIELVEGELTVAQGQSLVLYRGTTCIGGGIIS
jgi:tRNA-specific 2-thiouridylase